MAKKMVLYEPNLCCPTGVCGPNPDLALIALQDAIDKAKEHGIETERLQITSYPRRFTQNAEVMKLMQQQQLKALPITEIDGEIIKVGKYPTLEEIEKYY